MARRGHDLRRALDVNENWTRMHNSAIVYACVCVIRMCIADVSGAAAGMQMMRLRLVLSRMSLLWRAVQVDLIARRKGVCAYAWVRCHYGV